jgi:hypothetical protein
MPDIMLNIPVITYTMPVTSKKILPGAFIAMPLSFSENIFLNLQKRFYLVAIVSSSVVKIKKMFLPSGIRRFNIYNAMGKTRYKFGGEFEKNSQKI